jgi:S1-C subfamily serine protease
MTTDGHDAFGSPEPPNEPSFWPSEPYQRPVPSPYPSQAPHPGPDYWYPPEEPRYSAPTQQWPAPQPAKSRRGVAVLAAAAVMALAIGGAVIGFSGGGSSTPKTSSFATPQLPSTQEGGGSSGSQGQTSPYGYGFGGGGGESGGQGQTSPFGSDNGGSSGSGGSGSGGSTTAQEATSAQQVGVVDINTTLDYGQAQAAGTGMVLTANGEILTNNHVVDGATTISVTIVSTGKTFSASVVGTDPTDDVAVLQLSGASGLATAKLGDSSKVAVGDAVTAVGNAGGTGGVPSAASGSVTALNQTITAGDENGSDSETLNGMIEVNANVQAGDSGGPLFAANNTVIGMDTAASTGRQTTATGYAIPIAKATAIADQIEAGNASATIHLGNAGFLGVQLQENGGATGSGAAVAGVIANSGAARAGLQGGDTITAVNGTTIADATGLSSAISGYKAGQQVSLTWTDSSGQSHTATVTLGTGPAD